MHISVRILLLVMLVNAPQYEEIEKVGQGGFGVVYRCRNTVTGEIVAVKNIFFHECDGVPSSVIREVSLLKELDHINIVR